MDDKYVKYVRGVLNQSGNWIITYVFLKNCMSIWINRYDARSVNYCHSLITLNILVIWGEKFQDSVVAKKILCSTS